MLKNKNLKSDKDVYYINERQIIVFYVETLVNNSFDIAPFLFKEQTPTNQEMLETINLYDHNCFFIMSNEKK
jgi:hypothetical protein